MPQMTIRENVGIRGHAQFCQCEGCLDLRWDTRYEEAKLGLRCSRCYVPIDRPNPVHRRSCSLRTYVGFDSNERPLYVGDTVVWNGREWMIASDGNLYAIGDADGGPTDGVRATYVGYINTTYKNV